MHELQKKLLRLAQEVNLGELTLRGIGELINERSPQKVKHHLNQLEKKGLIHVDRAKAVIRKASHGSAKGLLTKARLLIIPILGSANAGPALRFADENVEGYLRISSTLLHRKSSDKLFALKVDGPSMNRAEVDGKTIEDGDYVIVDSASQTPRNGEVVLSIIDGMANIKRFYRDKENNQIVLVSDSSQNFSAIHIHEEDDFMINGKIVQVIKKPRIT